MLARFSLHPLFLGLPDRSLGQHQPRRNTQAHSSHARHQYTPLRAFTTPQTCQRSISNMASTPVIPPFLRLLAELRLIIYELTLAQRYATLPSPENAAPENDAKAQLVIESLPVAVLRVCKFIHNEAITALGPQLDRLRLEPPKIILTTAGMAGEFYIRSTLDEVLTA
jgi:hypothetical protein